MSKGETRTIVFQQTAAITNGKPLKHPDHVRHIYRKNQILRATPALIKVLEKRSVYFRDYDASTDAVYGNKMIGIGDVPPLKPGEGEDTVATKGSSPNADVMGDDKSKSSPKTEALRTDPEEKETR